MRGKTLSPFSFFGGKGRFAHEIADMLDYKNTDIYVEPFGGACRVLLNKPRHKEELYNELGTGLVTFFEALSDKNTADMVIRKLNDMEISEEIFIEQQEYRNEAEMDIDGYITKQALSALRACRKNVKGDKKIFANARRALNRHEYYETAARLDEVLAIITDKKDRESIEEYRDLFSRYWEFIEEDYSNNYVHQVMYMIDNGKTDTFSENDLNERYDWLIGLISNGTVDGTKKTLPETGGNRFDGTRQELIDDILNNAGGIEKIIEQSKLKGWHEDIHKAVLDELHSYEKAVDEYKKIDLAVATFYTYALSLYGRGIEYCHAKENERDAYYRRVSSLDDIADRLDGVSVTEMDALFLVEEHRKESNAMIYLDPPYLNDKNEDLGEETYAEPFSADDHKRLLQMLLKEDTKAKILISNYNNDIYNKYLTEEKGWKKFEIETYTSIGGKKDNKRTEVLWYNY